MVETIKNKKITLCKKERCHTMGVVNLNYASPLSLGRFSVIQVKLAESYMK